MEDRKDPDAWIPLLERYLPESLRAGPVKSEPKGDIYKQGHALGALLSQARLWGNVNLLAYLGFQLNRWPAVHAILNKLIDSAEALQQASIPRQPISSFDWGTSAGLSLDEVSSGAKTSDGIRGSFKVKLMPTSPLVTQNGLYVLSGRPFANELSRRLMAEVWSSLGSIVLDAADISSNDSQLAMSYVFQILARLHHSGFISDNVYKYSPTDANQVSFRPPGMYLLSTYIMSVLSDAAWRVHEADVAAKAAAAGEESPFVPFKMGFRELGPEIWFELILWCCVDHAHYTEGAWLLERMKERKDDLAWSLKSWKSLLEHPESVRKTNIDTEEFWHHVDDRAPSRSPRNRRGVFHGVAKRTISVEVVTSLLEGLVDNAYLGFDLYGLSPSNIRRYMSLFTPMIVPVTGGNMQSTTKAFNWLTVRNLESGGLNAELDPKAFEQLLRLNPHVVPPWDESGPPLEEDLDRLTKSQLYDDTSAFAGLIEYNIRFYASQCQSGAAFTTFAWLQEVVDSSKMRRIHDFLEKVTQPDREELGFFDSPDFAPRRVFYESTIPQMSHITFARLLDLATTAGAFTFGRWLLYSEDVDGPPIPPSAYGNQALAPSILRFAAATKDTALCDEVARSLPLPISVNTLRALMNNRIALGEWDRVIQILEYIRDHRSKSWGHSNVASLAAAVLEADGAINSSKSDQKAIDDKKAALDILLRLFNGEFNDKYDQTESSFQRKVLYSFHSLFRSIPGPLQEFAKQAPPQPESISPHQVPIIPSSAFHPLLTALVRVQGSAAGKKLWERWCVERPSPFERRLREGGVPRLYLFNERDRERGDPHFDAAWFQHFRRKAIIPNLDTVRIIAQTAVDEYNQLNKSGIAERTASWETKKSDVEGVLMFCVKRFRNLGLSDEEIDWEVQGFLSGGRERSGLSSH